jgi:hypothetical protein
MKTPILIVMLALSTAVWAGPSEFSQDCKAWQECRQLALEAAAREDYNAFHDLAWRALQAGPKNDPGLMTLLARAQSLSGRPGDALVMLQRLAAMGIVTDAATNDDFSRVRALPSWPEFEARTSGIPPADAATTVPAAPPPASAPAPPKAGRSTTAAAPKSTTSTAKAPAARPGPATADAPKVEPSAPEPAVAEARAKPATRVPGPLSFSAPSLDAVGLAYDAVSGRFIIGDRKDRRLLVVGERSGRMASLAGVDAGFDEVTAFEIDAAEGDLWVVSASSASRSSTLHKLQLISGRVLASIPLPADDGPGLFTDVAVTPQNILVLDGEGRRIYQVAKKGRTLQLVARLAAPACSSLAPAADGFAYAAYDRGLIRIDLSTRATTVVEAPAQTSLEGLRWLRSYRGSLVAIQSDPEGSFRLLRLRLDDSGRRVRTVDVLDGNVALSGPTSATVSGGAVHYLSRAGDDEIQVKKLTLK